MKRSVVTCAFNSFEYFDELYRTLTATSDYHEFVVVDNGSRPEDRLAEVIPQRHPEIVFERLWSNVLEGGGVCRAMQKATGDLVYKIDPDVWFIMSRWMERMEEYLKIPGVGAVITEPYGFRRIRRNGYDEAEMLIGTLFLLPRSTIDICGYWDPELLYGVNEWDYAVRIRRAGLKIAVAPIYPFYHKFANTGLDRSKSYVPLLNESWKRFGKKWAVRKWSDLKENAAFYPMGPQQRLPGGEL